MAVEIFLKLDGVTGESKDAKHKDEIDVLSFDYGGDGNSGGPGLDALEGGPGRNRLFA